MPHYIPRDGSSAAPSFDDTQSETMPETVTGVPLQFSAHHTSHGQYTQPQPEQLPPTAVARPANTLNGRRTLVDTSASRSSNGPAPLRASDTRGAAAAPATDDGITARDVIRETIVFPFRVVDFTVRLPFRAIGAAHKAASRALHDDTTDPLRNYRVDANQYRRERRSEASTQREQYAYAAKKM